MCFKMSKSTEDLETNGVLNDANVTYNATMQ